MINLNHCLITKIFILCDIRVYVYIYFGFSKYTSYKTNTALAHVLLACCNHSSIYTPWVQKCATLYDN